MEILIESYDAVAIENLPSLFATRPEKFLPEYSIMLAPAKGSADAESTICPDHWDRANKARQENNAIEDSRFIQSKTMNQNNGYNFFPQTCT